MTLSTTKRVTSLDWNSYPILRFEECPEVTPVVVQRLDQEVVRRGRRGNGGCGWCDRECVFRCYWGKDARVSVDAGAGSGGVEAGLTLGNPRMNGKLESGYAELRFSR